ncbi:unnamed protein product [Mytilus coruscus]|uniref:Uncharacterized protein n=1 Tax=Mytilus coruscus TaxID=42192 RepID=A0A6J8ERQ1_MYTCO|nr:unnamed protein product [Mytilus coruscus]
MPPKRKSTRSLPNKLLVLVNETTEEDQLEDEISTERQEDSQNIVDKWATENLDGNCVIHTPRLSKLGSTVTYLHNIPTKLEESYIHREQSTDYTSAGLGHIARIFSNKHTCSNCAKEECNLRQCPSSPKCVNCSGDHPTTSARCLKYQQILKRLEIQRILRAEIRRDENPY